MLSFFERRFRSMCKSFSKRLLFSSKSLEAVSAWASKIFINSP